MTEHRKETGTVSGSGLFLLTFLSGTVYLLIDGMCANIHILPVDYIALTVALV